MIDLKEFYPIDGFSRYLINRSGDLWDSKAERFKTWTISKPVRFSGNRVRNIRGGRKITTLYPPIGDRIVVSQHRLLADTFIKKPVSEEKLVVNHIDGDPSNNTVSNLEWVTYSQNTQHMYDTGLCAKVVVVELKLVNVCEILKFPSIQKCAEHLNISASTLESRITSHPGKIFPEGYSVRREDSPVKWSNVLAPTWSPKPVCIYDIFKKELHTFETVADAGRFTGIKSPTINAFISRKTTIPLYGYLAFEHDALDHFKNFNYTERQLKSFRLYRHKSDLVSWVFINLESGEETFYFMDNLVLKYNMSRSRLGSYMEKGISPCKMYRVEKVENQL